MTWRTVCVCRGINAARSSMYARYKLCVCAWQSHSCYLLSRHGAQTVCAAPQGLTTPSPGGHCSQHSPPVVYLPEAHFSLLARAPTFQWKTKTSLKVGKNKVIFTFSSIQKINSNINTPKIYLFKAKSSTGQCENFQSRGQKEVQYFTRKANRKKEKINNSLLCWFFFSHSFNHTACPLIFILEPLNQWFPA